MLKKKSIFERKSWILGRFIGRRVGQVNSRKPDAPWRRFYGGGQRRGAGVSAINTSRRYPRELHDLSLPSTPLISASSASSRPICPILQFIQTPRRLNRGGIFEFLSNISMGGHGCKLVN